MGRIRNQDLPHYLYADYVQWKGRWELMGGIPYAMTPAPSIQHQRISHKIAVALTESLKECEECQALLPVDWKISDDTIVQPDNLIVCGEVEGAYLDKAPVLIFEILSKSTEKKDTTTKFSLYEKEGVHHYIIVSPQEQLAKVYTLNEGRYFKVIDATHENIKFDLGKCRIEFGFSDIWA